MDKFTLEDLEMLSKLTKKFASLGFYSDADILKEIRDFVRVEVNYEMTEDLLNNILKDL